MRTNFELSNRLQRDRFSFIVPTLEYRCTCYATGIPRIPNGFSTEHNTRYYSAFLFFKYKITFVERKRARGIENMDKQTKNECVLFPTQFFNTHIYIYKNIFLFSFAYLYVRRFFAPPFSWRPWHVPCLPYPSYA